MALNELYEFSNFRLNVSERLLTRGGVRLAIPEKVFETLCVLVKNAGRLVEKDELMEQVWGDTIVEENNLDKKISALRRILGERNDSEKFIETVRGHGYRFVAKVRSSQAETRFSVLSSVAPFASSTLIGREEETAEIESLLQQQDVRLVTLTGAGGTGKTKLARKIADDFLPNFADGVFFIELDALTNPELIVSTIAQMLDVKECGKPLIETLRDFLRERRILLVLDNFEQIISAALVLSELLLSSFYLKILVTSRAKLHINAEREFIVPPLAVPPENSVFSTGELNNFSAVKLFVERAKAVKPNFALSEENARSVAGICARLDGLPLAIEFAAARTKLISPAEILKRLENRLHLLTSEMRDLPARQRTMRGAIEWSYDLLNEKEKKLFRRLAVFAGSFTIEAAETVVSGEWSAASEKAVGCNEKVGNKKKSDKDKVADSKYQPPTADVLESITSLIDNNLLTLKEQASGETRLRMLEVVREYALEQLRASGEYEILCRAHAAYFLALAEKAEPELTGVKAGAWLEILETELDNFRAAIAWSIENEPPTAMVLANLLWRLWALHGHLTEGRKHLETVLERDKNIASPAFGKALHRAGYLAQLQGDFETARKFYRKSLTVSEKFGDRRLTAYVNRSLGIIANAQGDFASGRSFAETSLQIGREIADERVIAISLADLGEIERTEQNFAAARPLYEEALTLFRRDGDKNSVGTMLCNLGALAFVENDLQAAHLLYSEALANFLELGNKIDLSIALDGFAALFAAAGDWEKSVQLAGATARLRETTGCELEFADRPFREKYLKKVRAALDKTSFAEIFRQGQTMNLDDVVRLAESQAENFDDSILESVWTK